MLVQIITLIIVAIITSYLTIAQASIPRKDAEKLINDSEMRTDKAIDKLDEKQDKILEKLEDLQLKLSIIGEHVGVKK